MWPMYLNNGLLKTINWITQPRVLKYLNSTSVYYIIEPVEIVLSLYSVCFNNKLDSFQSCSNGLASQTLLTILLLWRLINTATEIKVWYIAISNEYMKEVPKTSLFIVL